MKVSKEETIEVTLKLTDEEARWLKSVMQNPLYGHSSQDEDEYEKQMRSLFFEGLDGVSRKTVAIPAGLKGL